MLAPELDPNSSVPRKRLMAVRGFARYLTGIDSRTEVPPARLVTYRSRRRVPHLFSDADVVAVIAQARGSTSSSFRADTLETLIGLLAATGMRVGEALRLEQTDIDWDEAVVLVRDTKFGKGRNVVVSPSTIDALATYRQSRDKMRPGTARFFVSLAGTPLDYANFSSTFDNAVAAAEITERTRRARIHDLRHSFAIRTLLGWYQGGRDVEALLPRLSTYLGHRDPTFTYQYLTSTPELLGYAAARLEAAGTLVP